MMEGKTEGKTAAGRATDSNLRLDVSVLTDRAGKTAALMDKNGLYVFAESVEYQIEQYQMEEQEKAAYYKTHVFQADAPDEDRELEYIRSHVFMEVSTVSGRPNPEGRKEAAVSPWLTAGIAAAGIMISVLYWRRKKKAREKRIADLDNRYDE